MQSFQKRLVAPLVFASLTCLAPSTALAAESSSVQETMACRTGDHATALDFWVGDWRVTDEADTKFYGTNRVERAVQGCAIFEHWTNRQGGEGKSLFYFDATKDTWAQVWVTGDTSRPGGLKLKMLVDSPGKGSARFRGELTHPDRGTWFDRTTLTPLADGTVRQHIEISDDGETWTTTFNAIYHPKKSASK